MRYSGARGVQDLMVDDPRIRLLASTKSLMRILHRAMYTKLQPEICLTVCWMATTLRSLHTGPQDAAKHIRLQALCKRLGSSS